MTTEATTTGRILALRLAATSSPDEAHELIQNHISTLDADSGRIVLAVALQTITTVVVQQSVDESDHPGAYRAQFRTAADRIAVGPTTEKEN